MTIGQMVFYGWGGAGLKRKCFWIKEFENKVIILIKLLLTEI
jgi:hypothetical protein